MELRQLAITVAIADHGSLPAAADALGLALPVVTVQLQQLEKELGSRLFLPDRRGVTLTEDGQVMIQAARRALGEIRRGCSSVGRGSREDSSVTVAMLSGMDSQLPTHLVQNLRNEHPHLAMRFTVGTTSFMRAQLASGAADVALLEHRAGASTPIGTPVVRESLWVAAARGSGLEANEPVPFASVAAHPLVLPDPDDPVRILVEAAARRVKRPLRIAAECSDIGAQISMVDSGMAWTVLPSSAVLKRPPGISAAPIQSPRLARTIALAVGGDRLRKRSVKAVTLALMDLLRNAAEAQTGMEWVGPKMLHAWLDSSLGAA